MKAPDYYLILGVRNDADEVVITAAYRALVKKYHPDTAAFTGPKNTEQFRLVQEAYEILRDGEKRRKYDEKLTPDYGQRTSTSNPKKANTKDAAPQTQNGKYKNPTTSQKSKIEPDDLTSVHFTKGLLKLEIFIDFCLKLSLVMTGLWLWSVGDRKGEQYNFWIVMAGWVCILYPLP